ncbi:hypothetical protein CL642_06260 [bacterium]|jgi:hypothetical protein|nr:hypothetical protein [bacterium]|tara:strand:- start:5671 stop:6024 length:354 start_codon:yes stop_codon:yes gene_type:complete
MQQKVNSVRIKVGAEEVELKDVNILKGSEGLYVETQEKIGTDNEGKDLLQTTLTMYPWENVITMAWTENTLIEQVKQGIILEALSEIEDFLEDYDNDEEEADDSDKRDDPNVNPYSE